MKRLQWGKDIFTYITKANTKKCFAYVANAACDKNDFILDFILGAGNIHDSVMFDGLYKK